MDANTAKDATKANFDLTNGREELNLAEFPLIVLGRRPKGLTKLTFEKESFDAARNSTLIRRLEIHATEEHGLARGPDMMVLHALLLIAKETTDFSSRVVHFSRYQLCEILGWPLNGNSYKRIEKALERWVSITLFYRAWYNRGEGKMENLKGFHILDDIELNDYQFGRVGRTKQGELPLSSIRFGERIFSSLHSGNVKRLNLAELFHLKLDLSQRLYSFLDKRFGTKQSRWTFNLRDFACIHLGQSTNYKTSEYKRKLEPAIQELVDIGFITDVPPEKRYSKISHGVYEIHFQRASRDKVVSQALQGPKKQRLENRKLIKRLTDFGVTAGVAMTLVENPDIPTERIEEKIEMLIWCQEKDPTEAPKRPGGWLAKAIREDWSPPAGFETQAERSARLEQVAATRKKIEQEKRDAKEAEQTALEEDRRDRRQKEEAVRAYMESLTSPEREAVIDDALQGLQAGFSRNQAIAFRRHPEKRAGEMFYDMALQAHILPLLDKVTAESR